jgi:murein DD-endopeptidase MepM/ murein hydrolase activator NlpD
VNNTRQYAERKMDFHWQDSVDEFDFTSPDEDDPGIRHNENRSTRGALYYEDPEEAEDEIPESIGPVNRPAEKFMDDDYGKYRKPRDPDGTGKFNINAEKPELSKSSVTARKARSLKTTSVYRVKRRDTLFSISRRFDISVDDLCTANRIKRNDALKIGMVLAVPSPAGERDTEKRRNKAEPLPAPAQKAIFIWPLRTVVSVKRDDVSGSKPVGIRITGRSGAPVVSSARGTVKKIGEMRGYGKYIIITHDRRFVTVYAGLRDIRVSEGERIATGVVIATIDKDDNALYFQIGREGKPVDPLRYLPGRS